MLPAPRLRTGTPADDRPQRPILGMGRGRMVAFAASVGTVLPAAVLHRFADAPIARWAEAQRTADGNGVWEALGALGSPMLWAGAAVLAFGAAAAMNWPNTARWSGMLLLGVLVAGLADIAVAGAAAGTATIGAIACILTLWQSRAWPLWAALGALAAMGRVVTTGGSASTALVGILLGAVGALIVEFCWHAASPDATPRRGADPRS